MQRLFARLRLVLRGRNKHSGAQKESEQNRGDAIIQSSGAVILRDPGKSEQDHGYVIAQSSTRVVADDQEAESKQNTGNTIIEGSARDIFHDQEEKSDKNHGYAPVQNSAQVVPQKQGEKTERNYGDATIQGSARVHQGDSITVNHYHGNGGNWKTNRGKLLHESLVFARMRARERNVSVALPNTCGWFFQQAHFKRWLDKSQLTEHNGFLWIKGKPGSGKSTLMKEIFSWAQQNPSRGTSISYFFNARATSLLERSSIGLYRSLVYQLLTAQSSLEAYFEQRFESKLHGSRVEDVEEWDPGELQNFLLEAVKMNWTSPLIIFVDALDEGKEDDVRDLVAFLEDLSELATLHGTPLRICLSSRHYPHISIKKGISVVLENQAEHDRDIQKYVDSKLHGRNSQQMDLIRNEILRKAAGVFLWVVLVVKILNKTFDKSQGIDEMMQKLNTIPAGLHELFETILLRDDDSAEKTVLLLQWVLYSQRPLTPSELYAVVKRDHTLSFAVAAPKSHSDINAQMSIYSPDVDEIKRFLLNTSRGLIEIISGDPSTVQFIHESVRDFLFGNKTPILRSANDEGTTTAVTNFDESSCHAAIAEDNLSYLLYASAELKKRWPAATVHTAMPWQRDSIPVSALLALPLLDYAGKYSWQHMANLGSTDRKRACELAVQVLKRDRLERWGMFFELLGHECRSCTEDQTPTPLYVASLTGCTALAAELLELGVEVSKVSGIYTTALQAAIAKGNLTIVQTLMEAGAKDEVLYSEGTGLQLAVYLGNPAVVGALCSNPSGYTKEVLLAAAEKARTKEGLSNVDADSTRREEVVSILTGALLDSLAEME